MQSFEDVGKLGKEFMDSGLKSFAAVTTGLQAIGVEAADYSKKAFETGSAAIERLVSAKSLDKAFEVQTDYLKEAYESFISQATRMSDLYAEMAKDAYKPFESAVGKVK
ncbi:phasin protein [Mesorhizobium sp. J18]|uniref:phasin family protein n=1 Tax=Mesorhizobium sp. J18 TaxID=935263 RepID=UPI001199078F|nr:phasin family protein [Mesorhizobium sp. J18]TWG99078.1 phasin protein [Mesorhizobium sp. J18]